MSYQGWSNRETWNAALWLSNDEGLYKAINRLQGTWYNGQCETVGQQADSLQAFAKAIRNFCVRQWPDLKTPDGDELGQVDWLELAASWVEP